MKIECKLKATIPNGLKNTIDIRIDDQECPSYFDLCYLLCKKNVVITIPDRPKIGVGDIVFFKQAPISRLYVVSHVLDDGRIALGSKIAWGPLYEPEDLEIVPQDQVRNFMK